MTIRGLLPGSYGVSYATSAETLDLGEFVVADIDLSAAEAVAGDIDGVAIAVDVASEADNQAMIAATGAKLSAHRNAGGKIPGIDRGLGAGDIIKVGRTVELEVLA